MGEIAVVNEAGQVGTLPEAEAKKAMTDGSVRPASADEFSGAQHKQALRETGLAGTAIAAGTGLLGGATMGLSDPAIAKAAGILGGGYKTEKAVAEEIRLSQEANPLTHGVSEGIGMVAPALLSGGSGAVGSVAKVAGAPMRGLSALGRGVAGIAEGAGGAVGLPTLGKVAGTALGAGAELGVYGATKELSRELTEESLGNHELNAERIFAAGAHDFLYGAALGGALGLGSVLAKKGASAATDGVRGLLKGKNLQEAAEEFSAEQMYSAGRPTQAMARKTNTFVPGGTAEAGRVVRDRGPQILEREIKSFDDLVELAPKGKAQAGEAVGRYIEQMEPVLEKAGQQINAYETLLDVEGAIMKRFEGLGGVGAAAEKEMTNVRKFFDSARRQLDMVNGAGELLPGAQQKTMKLSELKQLREMAQSEWFKSGVSEKMREAAMGDVSRELEKRVFEKADLASKLAGEDLAAGYRQAKKEYGVFKDLEKATERGEGQAAANNFFGITDKGAGMAGAVVTAVLGGGPVASLASGLVTQAASKYLRAKAPFVASDLAMAVARSRKVEQVAKVAQAARSEMRAAVKEAIEPAKVVAIERAPDLFGSGPNRDAKVAKTIASLEDHASAAQRVSLRLSNLGASAPKTADAVSAQTARVAAFLLQNAPKPTANAFGLAPWMGKPTYRPDDVMRFEAQIRVSADPLSVVRDAGRGRLDKTSVDTLRLLYPHTYKEARQEFETMLFDPKRSKALNSLGLEQQFSLATLFEIPHPLTDPAFLAEMQRTQQTPAQAPQSSANPPSMRSSAQGAGAASALSKSMETDTEGLENGVH